MSSKTILDSINFVKQCKKYGLPLWQCPQFLFLILGLIVIISSLAIYFIGTHYSGDPEIVALIILTVAVFLITVNYSITRSFERLAEVAKLKSEFISIVSHQLRGPLANLRWTIDLLISGRVEQVSEKQSAYLSLLRENSQRMEGLVSDLLIVSRLESDDPLLKEEKASLAELVKKIISGSEPLAKASNVEIKLTLKEDLPETTFDTSQIEQVISNLLDNAIRYIKDKGLVEISLSKKENFLYLEVKDNGIGISIEDQKYIFQKFFRSEKALKAQAHGSGLGLYIARAIIKRSGGKIGFVSDENTGSTFWFALPIK
ncbi:MAG: HAMP domain-containing sensor histidine kinase [bacterium]|nr:HAMP domain-containing sensor histidine kinase [bacterium]